MAAPTVYSNVAEGASLGGRLFAGKKFWVAQRIPQRARFLDLIRNNGGTVVLLEKSADYLIADHFRRDCPPGSISYTFIEESIKDGSLAAPDAHRAGPPAGTPRDAGSLNRPPKTGRAAYTAQEDAILYKWVRDHEKKGYAVSGNELYKQLEAEHPRHTWQSWRERYLKILRDRPAPSLAVSEDSPPSTHSPPVSPQMHPTEATPTMATQNGAAQRPIKADALQSTSKNEAGRIEIYTPDELNALFDEEEFEELHANVPHILSSSTTDYLEGWDSWSKGTSQTPQQWKQYFELVVLPQWKKDGPAKKAVIRRRVDKRHETKEEGEEEGQNGGEQKQKETPEATELTSPDRRKRDRHPAEPSLAKPLPAELVQVKPSPVDALPTQSVAPKPLPADDNPYDHFLEKFSKERKGRPARTAYQFWANTKKLSTWEEHPGWSLEHIHKSLLPQWNRLPAAEKVLYVIMEDADKRRLELEQSSDVASSTVAQMTPDYIAKTHTHIMKRIRDDEVDEFTKSRESDHQTKKRRQFSSSPEMANEEEVAGTQVQPLEITSGESSSSLEQPEESRGRGEVQDDDMEDVVQTTTRIEVSYKEEYEKECDEEDERGDTDVPTPTMETPDVQYPELGQPSSPAQQSSSTTPQNTHHNHPTFDTQAILSSPSQGFRLAALPRPPETQAPSKSPSPSTSPARHPESIASTTHSLREFRDSYHETDYPSQAYNSQTFNPLRPPSADSGSEVSVTDSTASEDQDPPLSPTELEEFFKEQIEQGFADDEIRQALKHTRCRPDLALHVLDAWKEGQPLPIARGIWSKEDDEDVESGDGLALARLERRHTLDGWGGITERLRFLDQCRSMQ